MVEKNEIYSEAVKSLHIPIKRNGKGDTRTSTTLPMITEVLEANRSHIDDVKRVMLTLSQIMVEAANKHDYTKIEDLEGFYNNMVDTMRFGKNFKEGKWYRQHVTFERHHSNGYCQEDINLFDLIEMCADVTCAAKARSGKSPSHVKMSDEILRKAFFNTIRLIDKITYIERGENV